MRADLILIANELLQIPNAIALAIRSKRIIKQNLLWAIIYNVVALPAAAAGLVPPWLAAIGMSLSSLIVVLNALRLTRASQ
jgi:Cu2+-exporting ATPase